VDGTVAIGSIINNATVVDSPFDSCLGDDNVKVNIKGASVWYMVIGTGERITVTTCNPSTDFDTVIGVYTDDSCETTSTCQYSLLERIGETVFSTVLAANDNDDSCTKPDTDGTMIHFGASTVVWDSQAVT